MRLAYHSPLILLLLVGCNSGDNSAAAPAVVPDSVHVARAIAGLRPQVEVEGRPQARWSLAERMEHYKVPGISVAIISGGKVVWAGGFGVKEAGTTDSVTTATLFQAASISKPVTATAMLRLVSQRKVALDTNVNRYLKSWQGPDNKFPATEKEAARPGLTKVISLVDALDVIKVDGLLSLVPITIEMKARGAAAGPDLRARLTREFRVE